MFKYILLGSLLVHCMWAKPVEHHVEAAPHIVIVTPQAQLSLESLVHGKPIIHHTPFVRYVAPHEESFVYVPASIVQQHSYHHNEARSTGKQISGEQIVSNLSGALSSGVELLQNAAQQAGGYISNPVAGLQSATEALSQGLGSYLQGQQQQQQQLQEQQQLKIDQLLLLQKQRIYELEQQIQKQNEKKTSTLLGIETPFAGAQISSNIPISNTLETVVPAISILPNTLLPILKQKSLGNEPQHHYVVEQPRQVLEYIPVVVNPVPVTPTVKARRSVLPQVQDDIRFVAVEENNSAQEEKVVPVIAKLSTDINLAPQQAAVTADDQEGLKPVVNEQGRSLEADKQNDEPKKDVSLEDKKPVESSEKQDNDN